MKTTRTRLVSVALAASLFLAACGGGSTGDNNEPAVNNPPTPTTGTVGLFLTDKPTDELESIFVTIEAAILIGADDVDGQQVLYQLGDGETAQEYDLLNLQNFNEPIIFGEVQAGVYTKLRLRIGSIRLIEPDGTERFPALPANGKIDLLEPNGIEVLPGRTLLVEVDMDADKSFLAVGAGNSGNWKFRPVVKAKFTDGNAGEFPDGLKLARIEGTASNIVASTTDGSGTFTLCATASPDSCVDVAAADPGTSIFGPDGAQALFGSLMDMDPVTVIGSYSVGDGILLNAVLLEIGGNAELVSGEVVSDPADGPFLLLKIDESNVTVHLQDGTLYFNQDGTLTADDVVLGADIDVEGVVDTDQMRAALVFVSAPQDEQISGAISVIEEGATDTFTLTTDSGDVTVTLVEGAYILLVDVTGSTVTMAEFADLYVGQIVDIFGTTTGETTFEANEVIVDVNASPPPPAP